MKSLAANLAVTLALGGLVAALVDVFPLEAGLRQSALLGAAVSTVLGAVALLIKTQLAAVVTRGTAAVKALVTGQTLAFLLRLLAVGVGAFALKQDTAQSPIAFVVAFFAVYLAQQFVEVRSLLAVHGGPAKSSEVSP